MTPEPEKTNHDIASRIIDRCMIENVNSRKLVKFIEEALDSKDSTITKLREENSVLRKALEIISTTLSGRLEIQAIADEALTDKES